MSLSACASLTGSESATTAIAFASLEFCGSVLTSYAVSSVMPSRGGSGWVRWGAQRGAGKPTGRTAGKSSAPIIAGVTIPTEAIFTMFWKNEPRPKSLAGVEEEAVGSACC